jgi:hypothetical protein
MKRTCVFLAALLLLGATFAAAQPVPGKKFEFGTSLALYSYNYESEMWSDSWTVLNVPIRFGWFIWKGLQIEPEVVWTIPLSDSKGDSSYFLQAHLAYNFKAGKRLVPFAGGTIGYGNGIPYMGWVSGGGGKVTGYGGLAGVKYLLGNIAAIRAEYRLLFYDWNDEDDPIYDETGTIHQFFVGLSIFF